MGLAKSPKGSRGQEFLVDSPALPKHPYIPGNPRASSMGIYGVGDEQGTNLCSTRTSATSRLKERMAPLLKPQKKIGCLGWKATAHGASSGDVKS